MNYRRLSSAVRCSQFVVTDFLYKAIPKRSPCLSTTTLSLLLFEFNRSTINWIRTTIGQLIRRPHHILTKTISLPMMYYRRDQNDVCLYTAGFAPNLSSAIKSSYFFYYGKSKSDAAWSCSSSKSGRWWVCGGSLLGVTNFQNLNYNKTNCRSWTNLGVCLLAKNKIPPKKAIFCSKIINYPKFIYFFIYRILHCTIHKTHLKTHTTAPSWL